MTTEQQKIVTTLREKRPPSADMLSRIFTEPPPQIIDRNMLVRLIRAKCLVCSGCDHRQAADCGNTACPLHAVNPYRICSHYDQSVR